MIKAELGADNLGGVSRLVAIGGSAFRRIRTSYPSMKKYLEVISSDEVIEITDVFFDHNVKEDMSITDTGYLYNVICSGAMLCCPENAAIANKLYHESCRDGWIVLSVDSLGRGRVYGSKGHRLYFESSFDSGTAPSDTSKITFTFSGELPDPPVSVHRFTSDFI